MEEFSAEFETPTVSCLELIYDMIRQQKQTSAAAAKKAAAALRAQLHQELESKKLCSYSPHECTQLTLDGYDYCLRHIMEDKNAPFRQCNYIFSTNGKRCHLPAPKGDKKEYAYCSEHAFKTHLNRIRMSAKQQPPNSMELLLDNLSHYVKSPEVKNESTVEKVAEQALKVTKHLDPLTEIDASAVNTTRSRILDYASESESDVEQANYTSVWHDAHADSSDDESIDSEQEDVLKHAGIYTAEEVILVTRDKLIRLQSLYIEQFKYLQHVLRERRRKYLNTLKREKDGLASIHDQPKDSPKEHRLYAKLKALNRYNKKHGIDAIMNKRFTELRAKLSEGSTSKPSAFTKCIFSEGGVKCGEKAIPVAKHCRKHILHDRNQVLFKQCSKTQIDFECNEPVLSIFKDATCKYHTDFPPIRHYGETRTFDDSDMEDSSDTHDQHVLDLMASSSCESRAPANHTEIMTFSNQFPPQCHQNLNSIYDDANTIVANMQEFENSANSFQQLINITNMDDENNEDTKSILNPEEQEKEIKERPAEIKIEKKSSEEKMIIDETAIPEISVVPEKTIDPDDEMAGIMMELEKDHNLDSISKNLDSTE